MPDQPTSDPQHFYGDMQQSVNRMLRRLRMHNRTNLPAVMAQKAMSSFTLQHEAAPDAAMHDVTMLVYPQNPFVGQPEVRRMSREDVRPGLMNDRIRVEDSNGERVEPDEEGHYLYWPGDGRFEQVNAFYYATFTLRMYERYARREIPWAFPAPRLRIDPHIGDSANAFYDEEARLIGFHTIDVDGKALSTASSADVVTHETAHAVLDGLRDLFNESFGLGPRAFHESFSDITTILVSLHDDSLLHRLLEWTDNDLRTSNFVSEIAENLTELLQAGGTYRREDTIFLRNAFNTLVAQPFDDLSYMVADPQTMLSRQEHNYSRLFTGVMYDLLVGIYEHLYHEQGQAPYVALIRARERVGHLLVSAVELGPVGEFDFADMARSLLTADCVQFDREHVEILRNVLAARGILSPDETDAHLQAIDTLPDIKLPPTINNAMSAMLFLEDVLMPELGLAIDINEYVPLSTYRNGDGQVYMMYFQSRSIRVVGEEFGAFSGCDVDIFGGLTLMFDADDTLCSVCFRPVTDEDTRRIHTALADLIAHDAISWDLIDPESANVRQKLAPPPQGLFISVNPHLKPVQPGDKLVKYPVIFDSWPRELLDFVQYLRKWQHKQNGKAKPDETL
jgi:hypothetical protein